MTQVTLVETCRYNLQTTLPVQIGVAESCAWKQLVQQGEQAEEIVARVKAEESKPRPEKSTRRAPEVSSQAKRKDTLATETKSLPKPQLTRGGGSSNQTRTNKQYSFKDEHVDTLFKLLNKSNILKLSEAKRSEEVGKTGNPNYYLYHRMMGHPTKNCYIFKDIVQALIDAEVLKLHRSKRM